MNEQDKHLTADEFIDRLYGLGSAEHLNGCAECTDRLQELLTLRAAATPLVDAPHDFLAAQRRNIYARMGERPQARWKWVPAMAAAICLIAAGVFSLRPQASVVKQEIDEAQLYSDVYSMEQSMEPIAAKPIAAIFEQDHK
ncbi:MAG TPA: hypothetical protein VMT15_06710 [Bryobacteraceae bacterium]|nr:hypothetical protein [Dongiaceae bacterium]HVO97738.1 hypothetical protein [Bryobacteraceae bacterium]